MRLYRYVGPPEILDRVAHRPLGRRVTSSEDLLRWLGDAGPCPDAEGLYCATFVVDAQRQLRVEDYGYEHVACAGGSAYAAGVAWFDVEDGVRVARITNQSTGFCPDPSCWGAVAEALDAAGIAHPGRFEPAFDFRRCEGCGETNLIKDDWFVCVFCERSLPAEWNVAAP